MSENSDHETNDAEQETVFHQTSNNSNIISSQHQTNDAGERMMPHPTSDNANPVSSQHQASDAGEVMVFHPTSEELKDFPAFIESIESKGAHKFGIAKIIPPANWMPRKEGYTINEINKIIPSPITQVVVGSSGVYKVFDIKKKKMSVEEFYKIATSAQYDARENRRCMDVDRTFWRTILYGSPIYGADVPGTLMDDDLQICNINKLGTILDLVAKKYGKQIAGVNTAYLYFGMWKSMFPWHTEDMDLYSINYLHFGAPKTWYVIPPEHGQRFERMSKFLFPQDAKLCDAFLRHKSFMISPSIIRNHSIPLRTVRQNEREIIVTFPYAYHAGFNNGFNIAESINFASPRWVEYGKKASMCFCRNDSVKIDMNMFVQHFPQEKNNYWLKDVNRDLHEGNEKLSLKKTRKRRRKSMRGSKIDIKYKYFDPISQVTVPNKVEGTIEITSPLLQPNVVLNDVGMFINEHLNSDNVEELKFELECL